MRRIPYIIILILMRLNIEAQLQFSQVDSFPVGIYPMSVCSGDFNSDSKVDLVVANYNSNNVSLHFGNGNGTFSSGLNYATCVNPRFLISCDINKDLIPDIAVANENTDSITIMLGDGTTGFSTIKNLYVLGNHSSICCADFNNDSNPDLAVSNSGGSPNAYILLGNGNGSFANPTALSVFGAHYSIQSSDFNGDGNVDLATVFYGTAFGNVDILLGNGNGTFNAPVSYQVDHHPTSVLCNDYNSDGKIDIVVGNEVGTLSLLNGIGNGTFGATTNLPNGETPIASADFNIDGKLDIATIDVSVFLGTGSSFGSASIISHLPCASNIVATDFNGDGKPDIAITGNTNNKVYIFLNLIPNEIEVRKNGFDLNIFPNPANQTFSININNPQGKKANFLLMDENGREILNKGILISNVADQIDVENLKNGIYNIQIQIDSKKAFKQVIINHN